MFQDWSVQNPVFTTTYNRPMTPTTLNFPTLVQTPVTPDNEEFEFLSDEDFSRQFNQSLNLDNRPFQYQTTHVSAQYPNMHNQQHGQPRQNHYNNNHNQHHNHNHNHNHNQHHNQRNLHNSGQRHNKRQGGQQNICKFFLNGNCTKGQQCNWTHLIPITQLHSLNSLLAKNRPRTAGMNGFRNKNRMNRGPMMNNVNRGFIHQQEETNQALMQVASAVELKGEILKLCRQQVGCRLLQRLVEEDIPSRAIIFEEIFVHLNTLVTDPFAHHLVLRVLDFVTQPDREKILVQLKDDLVAISLNVHGTRVVQKLLECMEHAEEFRYVSDAFQQFVITLAKDVYGMHVVLRCLHRIPAESEPDVPNNGFIFQQIVSNIVSVATHKHGCCVVQWCIDYANPYQRNALVDVIVENALELAQDAFGNYVLQQIMDTADEKVLANLIVKLKGSMSKLAVQKFSSIVVEKSIEMCAGTVRKQVIDELINTGKLSRLLQDPYANYVIQKILAVTRQDEFQEVVDKIRPHLEGLGGTPFGKRIKTQMIRRFPILSMGERRGIQTGPSADVRSIIQQRIQTVPTDVRAIIQQQEHSI